MTSFTPNHTDLQARDEAHFIELFLNTPLPFTIWIPDDFDYSKMNKIAEEKGILDINKKLKKIYLPKIESSDQEPD